MVLPETSLGDEELPVDDAVDDAGEYRGGEQARAEEGVVAGGAVGLDVHQLLHGLHAVAGRDQFVLHGINRKYSG